MFREAFNNHAKRLIDENCKSIIDQVHKTLWPRLVDKDTKRPVKGNDVRSKMKFIR